MKNLPLEFSVKVENRLQGTGLLAWKSEFIDMVKAPNGSLIRSSVFEGVIPMNKEDDIIGGVDIFLRLTCCSDGLETSYRKNEDGTFDFMNNKTGCKYNCKR
nr:unnamed protein product [Callosobruchus analis]